jgi:hypothetical protein
MTTPWFGLDVESLIEIIDREEGDHPGSPAWQ